MKGLLFSLVVNFTEHILLITNSLMFLRLGFSLRSNVHGFEIYLQICL